MHFKCVNNALQHVEEGSQCICNIIQFIVKMLTTTHNHSRMDEKCFIGFTV